MNKILEQKSKEKKNPNPCVEFSDADSTRKDVGHLSFSEMVHKYIDDNKDGAGAVQGMRDLAARIGIDYESFRKMVNRRRPVKERDFVVGVAAVLGMSSLETIDAIKAYNPCMGTFDIDNNERDKFLVERLDWHPGENRIEVLDSMLQLNHFPPLEIPGRKDKPVEYPYKMLKKGVTSACDFTYQTDPYDSLETEYQPQNYKVYAWMLLDAGNRGYRLTVDDSAYSVERIPALNGEWLMNYKSPAESGEFMTCFEQLQDMKDREIRRLCGYLFDTRNYAGGDYQGRYSAEFRNGGLHVYYEKYNYTIPELNEYYMMEYIDGTFRLSVSNGSRFMFLKAGDEDCRNFFGKKDPRVTESYTSEEEIEAAFLDKKSQRDPDYVRLRRGAYRTMRKKVEDIVRDLRDRKQFIRHLNYIWDDEDRVCQYYEVEKEYGCWEDECEMIAEKDSAEFTNDEGKVVTVTLAELKRAFELGYHDLHEILEAKNRRGSVDNIFSGV